MRKDQWLPLLIMLIILAGLITYIILNDVSEWDTLKNIFTIKLPSLNEFLPVLNVLIPVIVFLILLIWKKNKIRIWIWKTIGEGAPIKHRGYRFILPFVLAIPFVSYVLLSNSESSTPQVTQFSLLVIAPTLGGLLLAASGNKRIGRLARIELVSIAQKLIVSTILLIIFTSLLFTFNIFKGINVNYVEWSWPGFFRWAVFWGSAWSFYIGTFLFLLGISDLVLALHLLRK